MRKEFTGPQKLGQRKFDRQKHDQRFQRHLLAETAIGHCGQNLISSETGVYSRLRSCDDRNVRCVGEITETRLRP